VALTLSVEDPTSSEVVALLQQHLAFSQNVTPEGGVFALDLDGLQVRTVTFFCARVDGRLVGVAALQELGATQGELKSMHTSAAVRRQGIGRALVTHIMGVAERRGYHQVMLETGNFPAFAPARALYRSCGFEPCERYGPYTNSPTSACMKIELEPPAPVEGPGASGKIVVE
jgi:putative acetyltransferase